jgi:hypothetical protein
VTNRWLPSRVARIWHADSSLERYWLPPLFCSLGHPDLPAEQLTEYLLKNSSITECLEGFRLQQECALVSTGDRCNYEASFVPGKLEGASHRGPLTYVEHVGQAIGCTMACDPLLIRRSSAGPRRTPRTQVSTNRDLSLTSREIPRMTVRSGTQRARLGQPNSGCGVPPRWCREDPAACRVGSEGLKQRGRQPIRRGVRCGSPALQVCALLIRSKIPAVQSSP